jgi:hypothetical protein
LTGQDVTVTFTEAGLKTIQQVVEVGGVTRNCYGYLTVNPAPAATATTTATPTAPIVPSGDTTTTTVSTEGDDSPAINVPGDYNQIYVYAQPTQAPAVTPVVTPIPVVNNTTNITNITVNQVQPAVTAPAPKPPSFWEWLWMHFQNMWRFLVAEWNGVPLQVGSW